MVKWRPNRLKYIPRMVQTAKKTNPEKVEQTGKKLVNSSANINKGKRPRVGSNNKPEYQKVFIQPMVSESQPSSTISISQASSAEPILEAKEIQMPVMHTTRVPIKSSTNPFVNMTQSIQNAYDTGLPELQSMITSDLGFRMAAPLMAQLVDRTGRTAQSISKQINPETGQIYTNYFGVVEPNYAQWRKLHSMVKGDRPTTEEAGKMFQTSQMKTIFSRMQDLLGINPVEAKQVIIRKPYMGPQINVVSNFIGPDMGPGVYGYHVSTNEWWPLSKRSADAAAGNVEKYSMFSAIGEKQHLPQQISNRYNVIERGFTFEGEPFVIRANRNAENFKFRTSPDFSGPENWANSGSGSWKVRGKKQGGVLSAKSGIHIKKANRGKFTDYCGGKVTSACIARGKASSNPVIRKRATFAANARKWKHQNGGKIMPYWAYNILGGE